LDVVQLVDDFLRACLFVLDFVSEAFGFDGPRLDRRVSDRIAVLVDRTDERGGVFPAGKGGSG